MTFPCDECESIFNEKRNLMQHMKNRHGLKKFKCNFCDYRSNDRKTLKRHENDKHEHELFKCLQCDYRSGRKDMLKRHIHAMHVEKNIKHKLKNHKEAQHPPDDFYEKQAFQKTLYNKTWRLRGVRDLLIGLKVYKPKIKNTLMDYMKEKDTGAKWNLGVLVEMVKMDREGAITIYPGFNTSAILQGTMYNFDHNYANAVDNIQDKLIAFNARGSGWVLKNVHNISIDIAAYEPTRYKTKEYEEDDDDENMI